MYLELLVKRQYFIFKYMFIIIALVAFTEALKYINLNYCSSKTFPFKLWRILTIYIRVRLYYEALFRH